MLALVSNGMILSPCQMTALKKMKEFYHSSEQFFLLQGGAGTGKSTVICEFIDNLQKAKIAASAPTHKAVGVLRKMGDRDVECATIHSLLGLTLKEEQEERVLEEGRQSSVHNYDLVVVDESSMISSKLWELLLKVSARYETKFIFIGDIAQLPPVNETRSPIFDIPLSYSLTKIVRQAQDNPLMPLIGAVREKVFDRTKKIPYRNYYERDKERGAWVLEREQWLALLIRAFQSPKAQSDPNYVRAIAWTNDEVDRINWHVRNALFNTEIPFLEGERLIAKEAIHNPLDGKLVLPSCAELTVDERPIYRTSTEGIRYWRLRVENEDGYYRLKVPDPSEQTKVFRHLQQLAEKCRKNKGKYAWASYWEFRNQWANLKPCYGITSHQSQGSTYENAFVCDRDISRNRTVPERDQSRYVAFSRARSRLFIECY